MLYIFKYLKHLRRQKRNKNVYISSHCPWCSQTYPISDGKRRFRYNIKLKVGKFFCCGRSFKEENWLRMMLYEPLRWEIKNHETDKLLKPEQRAYFVKQLKENKGLVNISIVKIKEDRDNLPF